MTRGISQCDIHGEYLECGPHYSCPDCWEEKCKDDPPAVACEPNCPVRFEEAMNSTALLTEISHLRAQLAEAEKVNSEAWTALGECTCLMDPPDGGDPTLALLVGRMREEWKKAEAERDAAQARVGETGAVLREVRLYTEHRVLCGTNNGDECDCGLDQLRERMTSIDAALATSPHRLAGRGET